MVLSDSEIQSLKERYSNYYAYDFSTNPPVFMVGELYWDGTSWVKKMDGLVAGTIDITYNADESPATIVEVRGSRTLTSTFTWGAGTLNITEVVS
mgnify:CR=1 FL=1